MGPSLPLLSCELSMSVKEIPGRKKKDKFNILQTDKICQVLKNVKNYNLETLNALYSLTFFMSFVCYSYVIRMSSVCDLYVLV